MQELFLAEEKATDLLFIDFQNTEAKLPLKFNFSKK